MIKNRNCLIDLINTDNFEFFKFRNSTFDLKANFVNKYSQIFKLVLKWYE